MKTDIQDRTDIETLINAFYDTVKTDETIGYFFTEVVKVNWEKHLHTMYDFWENIVFHTGSYSGNPMHKHQNLNQQSPMTMEHFQHWIKLFHHTVDQLFEGPNSEIIKQRASSVATVMMVKILG